jgi:hypothetical protein
MGLAVAGLAAAGLACGGSEGVGANASLEGDVSVLQQILGDDRARAVLREVDEAVRDERPVMAASLIDVAIPQVERQAERFERAPVQTPEGRRLRMRAVRVHRALVRALALYRDALARGIGVEDETLLDALEAMREAELDRLRLYDELVRIRPLSSDAVERANQAREITLGGLPPLGREGSESEEPEGDPPAAPGHEPDPALGEPQEPLPE